MSKISEMSIGDVIKTDQFTKELGSIIKDLTLARSRTKETGRHPIDRLMEQEVFNAEAMPSLFAQAMDGVLQNYSSNERRFILEVGKEALLATIKKLKDEEEGD